MEALENAVEGKTGSAHQQALQDELKKLAADISTPGTRLNKLVTRTP
jgi:hypothetical protein